jgi:hypothetical protein
MRNESTKPTRSSAAPFGVAFDRYAQIMSFATRNSCRIDSRRVAELTNVCLRSAQRYLIQLEKQGYLIGDNEIPRGFRPSDKAKQLFGANP